MNPELDDKLRGIVQPNEIEIAEMEKLKERIYNKDGKKSDLKKEFENKVTYLLAGIPEVYWDITWDRCYVDEKIKNLVHSYCGKLKEALECGQGIIFTGIHGVGKTTLACLIGKTALENGFTCKYVSIAKIIDMISETYNNNYLKERLDTIVERVQFLILDDLGKEYEGVKKQLNPMVSLKLDSLLRERLNRHLVTIGTTNYKFEQIRDKYGDSVLSVVSGACLKLEVTGQDIRGKIGQKFWTSLGVKKFKTEQ